jgi:hypothetical protein
MKAPRGCGAFEESLEVGPTEPVTAGARRAGGARRRIVILAVEGAGVELASLAAAHGLAP